MTETVELVRGATTIDLFGGTDGFKVAYDGWVQARAQQNEDGLYEPPVETITLRADASSQDVLSDNLNTIDDMLRQAKEYIDRPANMSPVWLRAKLDSETNARRALVRLGYTTPVSSFYDIQAKRAHLNEYALSLERMPAWESPTSSSITDITLGSGGSVELLSSSITGSIPARLSRVKLYGSSRVPSVGAIYEFWMGFRSAAYGNYANLQADWTCTDGQGYNNTTSSGGSMVYVYDGDTDMNTRVGLLLSDVTTAYEDNLGRFLILLRAQCSGTRNYQVRAMTGVGGAIQYHQRVLVDSTSWVLYPLGYVDIPPERFLTLGSSYIQDFAIFLQSKAGATGSGNLSFNRLYMIPVREGFLHGKGTNIYYSGGSDYPTYIECTPEERYSGVTFTAAVSPRTGYLRGALDFEVSNFFLPAENNVAAVFAGQEESAHSTSDGIALDLTYYPRWLTLRGND